MTADDMPPMMLLSVTRAERAAEDIQLFELRRPDGGELPEFTPGAHIDVELPGGYRPQVLAGK